MLYWIILIMKTCYIVCTFTFHCVKSVRIRSYSSPHFPAFGLNTETYSGSLHIQFNAGKCGQNNSEYGHFLRSVQYLGITCTVCQVMLLCLVKISRQYLNYFSQGGWKYKAGIKQFNNGQRTDVTHQRHRVQHVFLCNVFGLIF